MKEAIAAGERGVDALTNPVQRLRGIAGRRLGRDRALAVVFQVELRQSTKFMERFSSTQLRGPLGGGEQRDCGGAGARRLSCRNQPDPLGQSLFWRARAGWRPTWILSRRKYPARIQDRRHRRALRRGIGATAVTAY